MQHSSYIGGAVAMAEFERETVVDQSQYVIMSMTSIDYCN